MAEDRSTILGGAPASGEVIPFPKSRSNLHRIVAVIEHPDVPGDWLVGVLYDNKDLVGVGAFSDRLAAIDFAVREARLLGNIGVRALRYEAPLNDGEPS